MWLGPALAGAAYLLGSVIPGLILARRAGVDLRADGSGNVGATNVKRVLGRGAGWTVMALDVLKGLGPTLAAVLLLGAEDPWVAATGVAAVVGHVLPIWHGLRGGKGAATAAGALLAAAPIAGVAAVVAFAAVKKLTRRASAGSLTGAAVGCLTTVGLVGPRHATAYMACGILAVVVLRHADNIGRLLRGTEPEG